MNKPEETVTITRDQFNEMVETLNAQGAELQRLNEFLKPKLYKRDDEKKET